MIISKLSIVLPASGPVSCNEVRVPAESKSLIAPVGGPLMKVAAMILVNCC